MPELLALPPWLLAFMAAWFFFVGGCIGSFMNVVIYRLPLGRSIVSPPSSCPKCKAAIRWHDNLPVIGWLMLGGKCRDCRAPISARYPLVEFLVGSIFLLLAAEVLLAGGPWWPAGLPASEFATDWRRPAAIAGMYAVLLCTLICAAYIAWDGQRSPWKLFVPALLIGAVVPLWVVDARPVALLPGEWIGGVGGAVLDGALGAAIGLACGAIYDVVVRRRQGGTNARGEVALALVACGWVLGALGTMVVILAGAVIAIAWRSLLRADAGKRSAALAGLCIAAIGWSLAGKLAVDALQRAGVL